MIIQPLPTLLRVDPAGAFFLKMLSFVIEVNQPRRFNSACVISDVI